jgi:hypothetical protein
MKRAKMTQKRCVVWVSVVLLSTHLAWSEAQTSTQFPLTPVDVSTITGPAKMNLLMGATVLCQPTPNMAVKIQAKTKSLAPLHGVLRVGGDPMNPSEGARVYFTLDHSQGEKAAYDTLFLDQNGDLDLSNDPAIGVDSHFSKEGLPRLGQKDATVFMPFTLQGKGIKETLRLIVFPMSETQTLAMVTPTMARQGHIKIGNQEHDIILAQTHAITGRYDHVWTACFMDGKRHGATGLLSDWPTVNDTLYQLTSNKEGTLLTVQPYAGEFGTLKLASDNRANISVDESGFLLSKTKLINLANCTKKDGIAQIPEDDYMPVNIMANLGDTKLSVRFTPGPDKSIVNPYSVHIRNTDGPSLKLPAFKDVTFTWANPEKTFEAGDQVKISAALADAATGLAIAGIADKDGQDRPPNVAILDSQGEIVTQGNMPFG